MSPGLRAAEARRCSLKSLLVNVRCGGVLDLLPGRLHADPGKHSPRLGIPGLYYAALSGLVWRGAEWWKRNVFQQRKRRVPGILPSGSRSSFLVGRGLGTFGLPQRGEGAEVAEIEESLGKWMR